MKSKVHFTADTHFYHNNIINYTERKYCSIEEMNEALIDNWNTVVKPEHIVYHLGDFSFAKETITKQILRRLNGEKHLIMGNHDKMIRKNTELFLSKSNSDNLFSSIQDYKEINVNGQRIVLSHYAFRTWSSSHHGAWALHGHSHNSLPPYGKSVDVGVDAKFITDEYRPISFEELKIFMDKRDIEIIDHHRLITSNHDHNND